MNRTISFFILFFVLSLQLSAQQNRVTIKGTVTETDGAAIPDINVALEGEKFGTATDSTGYYEIPGVPPGDYTFVVSGVAYKTERKEITVQQGRTLTINVTMSVSNRELQKIVVQSERINKFTAESTEYVSKIPIENISNPQSYQTITSELLKDQVTTNFEEALKNSPGLTKLWESTGRGNDGAGFYSLRGFDVQPTMINGVPSLTNGSLDPANIERIEVIKGPAGTLFGSSLISFGGLINVVTKKPYDYFGGEISYTSGSFGLNRIVADVNTPISEEKDVNLRVNSSYHTNNSFQDAGFNESFFIAPSLSYNVNDRLSFNANVEFLQAEQTNPTMLFLRRSGESQASNIEELNLNSDLSFTSNDLTIKNPTLSLQVQSLYKLSDNWTSKTTVSRSRTKSDGIYSWLFDFTSDGSHTFTRFIGDQNSTTLATDIQQNFNGNFNVGNFTNKIVAGIDFFRRELINNSTGFVPFGQVTPQGETDNSANLSQSAAENALESAPVNNSKTVDKTFAAYFSDVIEFNPRLSTMVSLRVDHFKNKGDITTEEDDFTQTALSPKFGIVLQPVVNKLSLFANYMNGFENVAPRIQDDGTTVSFSPEHANQWETGIKTNLLNGRVSATVSYYDITVSDVVRQDPDQPNSFIQDGEIKSRGFETSITASPIPGMNLTLGYSYNDAENQKFNPEFNDRRPERSGPQNLFNGWISYQITRGALDGFGFGFGGNYASEHATLNRESTGKFILPEYTVLNGSVFYRTNSFRIDIKADNLNDKEYFTGWSTINPQQPRTVKASFSYSF